jgi:hypothetical protein
LTPGLHRYVGCGRLFRQHGPSKVLAFSATGVAMNLEDEARDLRLDDDAIAASRCRIGRQLELLQVLERWAQSELAENFSPKCGAHSGR